MRKKGTLRTRLLGLLRRVRVEARLRQVDLAKKLRQPQSFVSKYESAERRLDLLELRQVCAAVGISLPEFVRRFEGDGE
jgi:transcriptional regulator with XRE-family HTH domain